MQALVVLLVTLVLIPLSAAADAESATQDVTVCMHRNVPEPDAVRAVRINTKDRTGSERLTVVRIFTRRGEDDLRQVRVEFREPAELLGSSVLLFERNGVNEIFLRTSDDVPAKRIQPSGRGLPFLGTDFSYEDFEHLLAFQRPEKLERKEDGRVDARPVYVLESTPAPEAGSMYQRIVTYVDQETCVPLRIELFEPEYGLRKKLVVDSMLLKKRGRMWLPQLALMEDLLNMTSTVLMVDSTEHSEALSDDLFALSAPE
jgi:hypothetical protein